MKFTNRAKMATSTTGTSTITLGSAVVGFQSFESSGIADGDEIRYLIEDGAAWEIGNGIYTSSGTTLTRVLDESSTGSLLNLSGNARVMVIASSQDFISATQLADMAIAYTDAQTRFIDALGVS